MDSLLTEEKIQLYNKIRKILEDLRPKFISCIDRNVVNRCGHRLEIMQGNVLHLNTEHENNVFFDYCLYEFRNEGINMIKKSFERFAKHYSGEELHVFTAAKEGYFAYLEILEPIGDAGLIVRNLKSENKSLMVDVGLNSVAKLDNKYTIVTHVIDFDKFIITTGASTPVNINTEEGQIVHDRFNSYMLNTKTSTLQQELQYITDMYKIIFYEDITGDVTSKLLPFGQEALRSRVLGNDTMH